MVLKQIYVFGLQIHKIQKKGAKTFASFIHTAIEIEDFSKDFFFFPTTFYVNNWK